MFCYISTFRGVQNNATLSVYDPEAPASSPAILLSKACRHAWLANWWGFHISNATKHTHTHLSVFQLTQPNKWLDPNFWLHRFFWQQKRLFLRLGEVVMLVDRLLYIPDAGHTIRKGDQITRFNLGLLYICPFTCWSNCHLTLQNVGCFGAAILPVKFGDATAPGWPRWNSKFFVSLLFGHLLHLDAWLKSHCGATKSCRITQHWRRWHECQRYVQD